MPLCRYALPLCRYAWEPVPVCLRTCTTPEDCQLVMAGTYHSELTPLTNKTSNRSSKLSSHSWKEMVISTELGPDKRF